MKDKKIYRALGDASAAFSAFTLKTHTNSHTRVGRTTADNMLHRNQEKVPNKKASLRRSLLFTFLFPNTGHTTHYSRTPVLELATEITTHKVEEKTK